MNILYVIAKYGTEHLGNLIHRELGNELQKHGDRFSVFALAHEKELTGDRRAPLPDDHPVYHGVADGTLFTHALNLLTKPWLHYERFGAGWWQLTRYLAQRRDFDLILAEGAYPMGALAALAARAPLIVTVAGGDFIAERALEYGYGRFRTARALMRWTFQRAAAIRVTTPLVHAQAQALGAPLTKLALIPRNIASYCYPPAAVPLAPFRAQAKAEIAARYPLERARVIVAAGRLLPIKGFDTLIRALPLVIEQLGDTRIILIGPNRSDPRVGDYQLHLKRLADTLKVGDKIIFTGTIEHPEMRAFLAAADVVAVPSHLEGMNKVVVEAAAVGTPSAVTATTGIADAVRDSALGIVVPRGAVEPFAAALVKLLCEPAWSARLLEQGPLFAQQFTPAVIGAQLHALCRRVLSS